MGLWSFVKNAFGSEAEAAEAPDAKAIEAQVKDLGLDTKGVDIKVDGDKVQVTGTAATPEEHEKLIVAVGNINGVAKVEAEVKGPDPVFYTVVKGDTLSAIAKKTLGHANDYNKIFEANRPMLKHPDKIYPGQTLRIPKA